MLKGDRDSSRNTRSPNLSEKVILQSIGSGGLNGNACHTFQICICKKT